jgi:hypothetical protein
MRNIKIGLFHTSVCFTSRRKIWTLENRRHFEDGDKMFLRNVSICLLDYVCPKDSASLRSRILQAYEIKNILHTWRWPCRPKRVVKESDNQHNKAAYRRKHNLKRDKTSRMHSKWSVSLCDVSTFVHPCWQRRVGGLHTIPSSHFSSDLREALLLTSWAQCEANGPKASCWPLLLFSCSERLICNVLCSVLHNCV